jgi:hypothetical protein
MTEQEMEVLMHERAALLMKRLEITIFLEDPVLSTYMRAGVAKVGTLVDPATGRPMADVQSVTLQEAIKQLEERLLENQHEIEKGMSKLQS